MELRQLRYFLAAAEEEHFHRAARRMHVAQPALSRQIAALERELGVALFEREKRRVRLSAAGRQFAADVARLLREIDEAGGRARRCARGEVGLLRVAFHQIAARYPVVLKSIRDFRKHHPEVELQLRQLTSPVQFEALHARDIDAAFAYALGPYDPALALIPLQIDPTVLALPRGHRLARQKHLRLKDLAAEAFLWIPRSLNAPLYDRMIEACARGGLKPRIVQEVRDELTTLNLVATGMALAFVSTSNRAAWVRHLCFRTVEDLQVDLQLGLYWRRDDPSALVSSFLQTVRSTAGSAR